MIKVFRKIRQKLLIENRFKKYLLYAIGEIVLVIIGILIALQINNWNEQNKIERDLETSLKAMTDEVEENIQFLSKEKKSFEARIERIKKLKNNKANTKDLEELLYYIAQDVSSKPFEKVFELVKEDKSLKLIKDKQLIKKINKFYEYSLADLDKLSEWHNGFVRNNIDPYILEKIPSENGLVDPAIVKKLMKQVKLNNIINYQNIFYKTYVNACNEIIKQAQELKTDITSYLDEI